MPEGDTIFRTARTLQKTLAGHRVTKFDTGYAHLARVNDDEPIAGRMIERCEAAGKHVLIVFEGDLILRTHMRMKGSWHLYRHGEQWWRGPQAMRVRVDTAGHHGADHGHCPRFANRQRRAGHAGGDPDLPFAQAYRPPIGSVR